MTSDLEAELKQVRVAYRLVVAYQRRLLDLAHLVQRGIQARHEGLAFHHWNPTEWPRPGTRDPLQKWAWCFVPLHHCEISWTTSDDPKAGAFWVWLTHEADTGWAKGPRGEPDPLSFRPAEACDTVLRPGVLGVSRLAGQAQPAGDWLELYSEVATQIAQPEWSDGTLREVEALSMLARGGGIRVSVELLGNAELVSKHIVEPLLGLIDGAIK